MTLEDGLDASHVHHHHHCLMDWLEDSISILPTFLNEPYSVLEDFLPCEWWLPDQNQSFTAAAAAASPPILPEPHAETPKSEFPKKRKLSAQISSSGGGSKKAQARNSISNSGGGAAGKEARWAEQLLNPLSIAIDSSNLARAQHLIYVLQELASATGDANHRLAFYGLQSLSRHFSPSTSSISPPPLTFASTEPRVFRSALIKFHEISAWFAFPNCLANAAILQAAAVRIGSLQLVDVGVSHGLQWPTLMEALARRWAGGQGRVRLTVVERGSSGAFGAAPEGYDFAPQLMRYAKSIDLELRVERGEVGRGQGGKEMVVLCVQFRGGRVGAGFWKAVREMEVEMVVVTEMGEGKGGGFGGRVEMLWRFLESTGLAFKGRECEERRVVEGEAARLLEEEGGEGRWRERMEEEGFEVGGFGEEVLEAGRGLLRKYDGNWEMRSGGDGAVGLAWKGEIVSFTSLWKPASKGTGAVRRC